MAKRIVTMGELVEAYGRTEGLDDLELLSAEDHEIVELESPNDLAEEQVDIIIKDLKKTGPEQRFIILGGFSREDLREIACEAIERLN